MSTRWFCSCRKAHRGIPNHVSNLLPTTVDSDDKCTKCGFYAVANPTDEVLRAEPKKKIKDIVKHYADIVKEFSSLKEWREENPSLFRKLSPQRELFKKVCLEAGLTIPRDYDKHSSKVVWSKLLK